MARWQLLALGLTVEAARHFARGTRTMGPGVYLAGHSRMHAGAAMVGRGRKRSGDGACRSQRRGRVGHPTVEPSLRDRRPPRVRRTAPGGRPRHWRSQTLDGDLTRLRGIPITAPERRSPTWPVT